MNTGLKVVPERDLELTGCHLVRWNKELARLISLDGRKAVIEPDEPPHGQAQVEVNREALRPVRVGLPPGAQIEASTRRPYSPERRWDNLLLLMKMVPCGSQLRLEENIGREGRMEKRAAEILGSAFREAVKTGRKRHDPWAESRDVAVFKEALGAGRFAVCVQVLRRRDQMGRTGSAGGRS